MAHHFFFNLKIVSVLPTDLFYLLWDNTTHCATIPCSVIVRMNRLLRLSRMMAFFDKTENKTNFPNAFRITKVSVAIRQ